MRKIQILRGTFAKKPNLEDGQMYLAKDTKQVFVGNKAITEGEIEFANKSDLTVLANEVNTQASDIADIQADYAQTTGGNTVTANGVVVSDENGKLKSITGNANQIVQFDSNKTPVAVDADFASKNDLNSYLPLSGGTLTGNIKVEPNDSGSEFLIFQSKDGSIANFALHPDAVVFGAGSESSDNSDVFVQVSTQGAGYGTINVVQRTDSSSGVNITLSENEAKIYAQSDTDDKIKYTPTSEASLVNKVYVDNAISAISSVNIEVSETQPTNQKAGDFWYHVTGTV